MTKFTITNTEISRFKYLFELYEVVAKKLNRPVATFSKGMRCNNNKMYIAPNIAAAMKKNFVDNRGLVTDQGFRFMMKNAGPQIDVALPDDTVRIENGFFI